ncbi:hypothetical protein WISP_78367 [Willisornis vidua]|uniref:Uncharacterized protein n=1 Tax=Willisornis vidua TaxID=1566151 RepID=A0ABQ9D5D3_9PASS|nr:hypothetical protein WISP_78367 [Willisornis vidua]
MSSLGRDREGIVLNDLLITQELQYEKGLWFIINGIDKGIKCPLSKLADDMKLSAEVGTPEGWVTIQWDLDKSENWAHGNLMKFNNDKCKLLVLV